MTNGTRYTHTGARSMQVLAQQWLDAKKEEKRVIERRRDLEDYIAQHYAIQKQLEGTLHYEIGALRIDITGRLDRKVDGAKLQELAAEAGLTDHLSTLFRWKPEIAMSAWKAADESITRPLLGAITTTAGRPSFSIKILDSSDTSNTTTTGNFADNE